MHARRVCGRINVQFSIWRTVAGNEVKQKGDKERVEFLLRIFTVTITQFARACNCRFPAALFSGKEMEEEPSLPFVHNHGCGESMGNCLRSLVV